MTDSTTGNPALDAAVAEVRELVAADGGDIRIASSDSSAVSLQLVLDTAECRECVMSRPFLEQVALDVMRPHLPTLATVTIIDPRERA